MRLWIIGVVLSTGAAAGCAGASGKSEVPTNPVPMQAPVQHATIGGKKAVVNPGPQSVPQTGAKKLS